MNKVQPNFASTFSKKNMHPLNANKYQPRPQMPMNARPEVPMSVRPQMAMNARPEMPMNVRPQMAMSPRRQMPISVSFDQQKMQNNNHFMPDFTQMSESKNKENWVTYSYFIIKLTLINLF